MKALVRSSITALLIAGTVLLFTVRVLAPVLPPFVGPPDFRETRSLKVPAAKKLRLTNADGSVNVSTLPEGAGIHIEADIKVYLRSDAGRDAVEAYLASVFTAQHDADLLDIVTEPPPDSMDVQVDYRITVPVGTDIEVIGSNGNVLVAEGCGRVSVRGENSDIHIVDPGGAVVAENTNGRIRVVGVRDHATIDTINGAIHARMRGGRLEATSLNGPIVAYVQNDSVQGCELASQNGGITVVLLDAASATVEASTSRGIIKTDFPFEDGVGVLDQKYLRGILGTGDVKLHIETLNGNIWVAKG